MKNYLQIMAIKNGLVRMNPNKKAIFEVLEQYSFIILINFVYSGDGLDQMKLYFSKHLKEYIE